MSKRKRPDSKSVGNLNEQHEKLLLDLIRSKTESGATKSEMRGIFKGSPPPGMITRLVSSLENNKLIKEVPQKNGVKHFRAMEFVPEEELTDDGGWYINGTLDLSRIEDLKEKCISILKRYRHRVVTLDLMSAYFVEKEKLSVDQTKEILNNLILDNKIMEVKNTGMNEFASTTIEDICYKLTGKESSNVEVIPGAFASVPCGACPNIGICTPDGVISPSTCVSFQKWLELDF